MISAISFCISMPDLLTIPNIRLIHRQLFSLSGVESNSRSYSYPAVRWCYLSHVWALSNAPQVFLEVELISSEKGIACDKEHEFRKLTTLFLIVFQCLEEDDRRFSIGRSSFCDLRFCPNSDPGNNKIYQHCKYAGLNKCPVLKTRV